MNLCVTSKKYSTMATGSDALPYNMDLDAIFEQKKYKDYFISKFLEKLAEKSVEQIKFNFEDNDRETLLTTVAKALGKKHEGKDGDIQIQDKAC